MQGPLVSIIIPTHNYGKFISETLSNLQLQSYQNWECLIIDNLSTDNTKEIVDAFVANDNRFKYFYLDKPGVSHARNFGLKKASGEFIQFQDADDLFETDKIKSQIEEFSKAPESDIVYGGVRYFPNENKHLRWFGVDGKISKTWMPEVSGKGIDILPFLINSNIMVVNAPLLRKSVIEKVGYFDENLVINEDWEYFFRCALVGFNFTYLNTPSTLVLVRSHSESATKKKEITYNYQIRFREKMQDWLIKYSVENKLLKLNQKKLDAALSDLACQKIHNGELIKGWKENLSLARKSEYPFIYIKNALHYTKRFFIRKVYQK